MDIHFSDLNNTYFDISDIFAVQQLAPGKTSFILQNPRATDGLLLFANTTGICYQEGLAPLYVPQGALVYLPHDSQYVWENSPPSENAEQENLLFEFKLWHAPAIRSTNAKKALSHSACTEDQLSLGKHVSIVSVSHSALYEKLFRSLIAAFDSSQFSPLAVYSIAYEIFHTVSRNCCIEQSTTADTSIIQKGIHCLVENTAEPKTIKEIAQICNISVSYFERVFHNYAGISPGEYRTLHRINHIKMLLQQKNLSLEEISEQMGYYDAGYLCRIFKKKTGMTPKEYRRIYFSQIGSSL